MPTSWEWISHMMNLFLPIRLRKCRARFTSARSRGAFISINHPCDAVCPFLFDMNSLPFDCLEIWNGPMRGSNLQAIGLWQSMLLAGKKVPICGGSDYHRDSLLLFPGGPDHLCLRHVIQYDRYPFWIEAWALLSSLIVLMVQAGDDRRRCYD